MTKKWPVCRISYIAWVITLIFLFSCGWTGEIQLPLSTVSIRGVEQNCFDDFYLKVKKYLKSSLQENEIHQFFSCLEDSIDDFFRKTEPKDKKLGYSFPEIRSLFNTFMVNKNNKVQKKYSKEEVFARLYLILKRLLIGGPSDFISEKEWQKMKLTFPVLKKFLVDTKPYTESYFFYRPSSLDLQYLFSGHKMFNQKLYDLIKFLKSSGSLLNPDEVNFLKDQILILGNLLQIKPVLDQVVHIFYEFQSSQHQDHWMDLIKIGEYGFRVMAYTKLVKADPYSLFSPEGFLSFSALIKSIIEAFNLTHETNQKKGIKQRWLEDLLISMHKSQIFLNEIKEENTLRQLISENGQYFFTVNYKNPKSWYVSEDDFQKYKFFYNRLMKSLSLVFSDENTRDVNIRYNGFLYSDEKINDQTDGIKKGKEVWNTIVSQVLVNVPFPKEGLQINFEEFKLKNYDEELLANFYKTILTNMILTVYDTYGRQFNVKKEVDKKIYEYTLKRLYLVLRSFFISKGLADPKECNAGERSFMEANLFGYSSNGDNEVSVQEGIEWLASAYSSKSVTNSIFEGAKKNNCSLGNKAQSFNQPFLKEECFREYLIKNFKSHFKHHGKLLDYIEKNKNLDDLYNSLFNVARTCSDIKLPLSYSEAVYYVSLIQYIETLFEKYDQDRYQAYFFLKRRDSFLDKYELMQIYKERFKNTLKRIVKLEMGGEISDFNTKHLYTKLLIYKKLILPEDVGGGLMWLLSDLGSPIMNFPLEPLDRIDAYTIFNNIVIRREETQLIKDYCRDVTLAWEEYQRQPKDIQNQNIFELETPYQNCR